MTYKLRKFVRRNRVAVITVCLVAAALAIGTVATTLTFLSSERLTVKVEQPTPNYRLVLDEQIAGMPVGICDFSPSGDRIVFKTDDNLYITDQAATTIRPLLDDFGPWETVGRAAPSWSPDGRLIAYTLSKAAPPDANEEFINAIYVLDPDDREPRQVGPDVTNRVIFSFFWTPDGRHLTYRTHDGIRTLDLDGNEVRLVPPMNIPTGPNRWGERVYSPYGRWLVTPRIKDDGTGRDLYILPATGGTPRRLTHLPGINHWPAWAPDGCSLYFVSGTADTSNIWKLPMDPETGIAKGDPQQVTFFKDTIVLAPKVLGDGSRIGFSMFKYNTYLQVADPSSPRQARSVVRCGMYSPKLSPDGQTVYYVNDTSGEEGIYAMSRDGGAPRRLTENLPFGVRGGDYYRRFDLSGDGRTLAYSAKRGDKQALFTVSTTGGEPQLLAQLTNMGTWKFGTVPQWSPDGSELAYADGNDLNIIAAAGGQPRKLAHMSYMWEPYSVCWSPDGKFIAAFGMSGFRKPNAVFVVPASGGELRQLTHDTDWKEGLEWHPDGQRLTYSIISFDNETHQAYLDGREPTLLVNAPDTWDYVGIWAPDGRRFFFIGCDVSSKSKDLGIYVYDESSGKTTQAIEPVKNVGVPCFSRNGTTMAWWEARETNVQAWIMENFLPESTAGD